MQNPLKKLKGVKVPHYKGTSLFPTTILPTPEEVEISMLQHIGAPCEPVVSVGDYVYKGQLIGSSDAFISANIHSSISGKVKGFSKKRAMHGGDNQTIIIVSDGEDKLDPSIHPPVVNSKDEFIQAIKASGLVGLGGAAFPSHVKFNPQNLDEIDTLIINGAECEPYITSDHRLMLERPDDLLDGVEAIQKFLKISKVYIGIEKNKPDAIALLDKKIEYRNLTGVYTVGLAELYPKGAERVIVEEITGNPLHAGILPSALGVIVSNVGTIAFIGEYLKTGIPLIKKRITVDGSSIKNPQNLCVPIGTRIVDIVQHAGGFSEPPEKIIMGGVMMGLTLIDIKMPIIKNTNAILAFNKKDSYIAAEAPCIHCGRCISVCPLGLIPAEISAAYEHRDIKEMERLNVMECMECASCTYVCPARKALNFIHKVGKLLVKEARENEK